MTPPHDKSIRSGPLALSMALAHLRINGGQLPDAIRVFEDDGDGNGGTTTHFLLLDYGWRDRVFSDGMYLSDALAAAYAISAVLVAAGHAATLDVPEADLGFKAATFDAHADPRDDDLPAGGPGW